MIDNNSEKITRQARGILIVLTVFSVGCSLMILWKLFNEVRKYPVFFNYALYFVVALLVILLFFDRRRWQTFGFGLVLVYSAAQLVFILYLMFYQPTPYRIDYLEGYRLLDGLRMRLFISGLLLAVLPIYMSYLTLKIQLLLFKKLPINVTKLVSPVSPSLVAYAYFVGFVAFFAALAEPVAQVWIPW